MKYAIVVTEPRWISNTYGFTYCSFQISNVEGDIAQEVLIQTKIKYNQRENIEIELYPKLLDLIIIKEYSTVKSFVSPSKIYL